MSAPIPANDDLSDPNRKREYNRSLFTEVAPKYDFVTRALSLGRDAAWKRVLIRQLPEKAGVYLDLACGTGDIACLMAAKYPGAKIIALDLTPDMIETARRRNASVDFRVGDMNRIPLPDGSVDVVTGGYALRNAPHLATTLAEIRRVLRPGGFAAFLDFSKPADPRAQRAELALLSFWGGLWGLLLHGNARVYRYIAESLALYPDRAALRELLRKTGFTEIEGDLFFFGIIELITFRRPSEDRGQRPRLQEQTSS